MNYIYKKISIDSGLNLYLLNWSVAVVIKYHHIVLLNPKVPYKQCYLALCAHQCDCMERCRWLLQFAVKRLLTQVFLFLDGRFQEILHL